MSKKTTMTDIAKALGVSQTLVSFVLSGKNDMGISADTKKKVLQAAEKMGYCSNAASKLLRLGRCGYIAVVFASTATDSLADILSGICCGLSGFGYAPVITDPLGKVIIDDCLSYFRQKRADGFIIVGSDATLEEALTKENAVFVKLDATDAASAEKCAVSLCEAVLSCDKDNNKTAVKKKKAAVKTARRKAVSNHKTETVQIPAETEKKQESIWLL